MANKLRITVSDNGHGMGDSTAAKAGHGMKNMRRRAELALKGTFLAKSTPSGTEISIEVPIEADE